MGERLRVERAKDTRARLKLFKFHFFFFFFLNYFAFWICNLSFVIRIGTELVQLCRCFKSSRKKK